jgi:MFS family permease
MLMAPAAMAGSFLGGFLETSHFSLLPNVAIAGGMDEGTALRLLSVLVAGGLVTQYGIGWLADRTSRRGLLTVLGLLYVALIAGFPFSLNHAVLAFVLIFLMGTAVISFYMLGLAMLGQEVQPSQLATANAAFILMYTSGSIIGPAMTGAAMSFGPTAGFVGTTALAALVLTAVIAFARGRSR